MKTKEAIKTLREYNRWRRGADIPQPDPTKIGKAIDFAIREMLNFQRVKMKIEKGKYYGTHNRGDA